ncbi:DUF6365 family protein [Rhizohabitans arisaemae]|uniref:DUF6365 family protein n=1 Tax=Rhizohabitans arisaemae TaxID=2720610 RepID=UPI0024B0D323|nr:DUF6365 family protein [Rhizohabitans arisaemae]
MSGSRVVLFIVTSFWAHGELAIATEFARRMRGTGFTPLFLIPPTHRGAVAEAGFAHHVVIPGAGKINRIQLADIQHVHRPALVVLADFLNYDFCDRHYGLTRDDLDVFECPIGTFDNFSWGREGAWLDTYGFKARYEGEITLKGLSFRLRPCPLNHPTAPAEPGVFPYPLLAEPPATARPPAREIRAALGLDDGKPVVLVAGATWQRSHAAYPRVTAFVQACTEMLERLLTPLLEHAHVVSVGPSPVFRDGAPPGYHPLGPLAPARFAELAGTVDLHVSNNVVSVSLHRLALGGVPSAVVRNSLTADDGTLSESAREVFARIGEPYPFHMFPVGWYHFLRSLLAGNPFAALITPIEVFREEAGLETLVGLLAPGPGRDRVEAARQDYLRTLNGLPDVETILRRIAVPRG